MLVKTEIARQINFDENYTGCAYREETDFSIRITLAGYKVMFQPNAVQLNLPQVLSGKTGAHADGAEKWRQSALQCNKYFLDKNWDTVRAKYGIASTKEQLQEQFENEIRQSMRKKTDTPFSLFLKRIYFLLFILPKYKRGSD
jgi:hypothetical protein